MKKIFTSVVFSISLISSVNAQIPCVDGFAGEYPCENVSLMSQLDLDQLGGADNGNDCWGWTSPSGKEIAIMCKSNGTSFVDISDPLNPILLGNLPTHTTSSLWRDAKVYNDYAFIVSEAAGHGMQVISLLQMENVENPPVIFEEDAHYPEFGNAHNIAINEDTGFAYAIGSNTFNGGLHIVNIQDPLNPVIAGAFAEDGYTHDTQVVVYNGPDADYQGKEIAFSSNEDYVTVTDVTDKSDCQLISTETYENVAYIHQGWLTEDHRYFLQDDEIDESTYFFNTRTHLWDMADLDNPVYMGFYEAPVLSSDHNLYTKGNLAFLANYVSGLRIVDISDIANANLEEVAYFDTRPGVNFPMYDGAWSCYPYFESGNVIISTMDRGLFVVRPDESIVSIAEQDKRALEVKVFPNPVQNVLNVSWSAPVKGGFKLINAYGIEVATIPLTSSAGKFAMDVSHLNQGMYFLHSNDENVQIQKIIIE